MEVSDHFHEPADLFLGEELRESILHAVVCRKEKCRIIRLKHLCAASSSESYWIVKVKLSLRQSVEARRVVRHRGSHSF
jgi:hypothetical protein